VKARSTRLNSSSIPEKHPLIQRCVALGGVPYGSPTLSDQALMAFPSFKLGPGESARSHTADEFICLSELERALDVYLQLLR
jgi:acetylornithine deacetylase